MLFIIIIFLVTVLAEVIDSGLGMMYGTLLAPFLILAGIDPKTAVPAVLISQAVGGAVAAVRHHMLDNANFSLDTKKSRDLANAFIVISVGILGVLLGSFCAISISKQHVQFYIAILVLFVSIFLLLNIRLRFSNTKMVFISLVSAFNKALSGGGYGPFMTSSQITIGQQEKKSISITTFAEVPICVSAFVIYCLQRSVDWKLSGILCVGAAIGGFIGPLMTKHMNLKALRISVAILALICGGLLLGTSLGWFNVSA
jgi:hypothetical protein